MRSWSTHPPRSKRDNDIQKKGTLRGAFLCLVWCSDSQAKGHWVQAPLTFAQWRARPLQRDLQWLGRWRGLTLRKIQTSNSP